MCTVKKSKTMFSLQYIQYIVVFTNKRSQAEDIYSLFSTKYIWKTIKTMYTSITSRNPTMSVDHFTLPVFPL